MIFISWDVFVLFLGLTSDRIHYDNVSSRGTVSFVLLNNPTYGK